MTGGLYTTATFAPVGDVPAPRGEVIDNPGHRPLAFVRFGDSGCGVTVNLGNHAHPDAFLRDLGAAMTALAETWAAAAERAAS